MKRIFAALILLVAFAVTAEAQTHYRSHVWVGGRAGVSMGMVSFSPSVKESFNMGTTGAVSVRYSEEKLFGLIGEIGWSTRGWKENYEGAPFNYSRSITYITVPVLTSITFGSRRFKTFINLGPQIAFLLSSGINSDFDYTKAPNIPDYPRNRQTEQLDLEISNKFDYGICASLGFEFYVLPKHSVTVEGRYYFGLGNIFPARKADYFSASRNTSIEITLGYNFRLK